MLWPEHLYLAILPIILAVHKSSGQSCTFQFPLGLKDRTIHDSQITASGSYGGAYSPPNARLDGPTAWFCLDCDASAWLQVDFLACAVVAGIIMQGRSDGAWDEYVNKYSVEYRLDEADPLVYITDADGFTPTVFPGPSDGSTKVPSTFTKPIVTRYIRIRPVEWLVKAYRGYNNWMSLRMELIGCPDTLQFSATHLSIVQTTDPGMATATVTWTIEPPTKYCPTAPITLTANKLPGDRFPIGRTAVDYTASDGSSEARFSMSVTVIDKETPVITAIGNVDHDVDTRSGRVFWVEPNVSDNSGTVSMVSDFAPGDEFFIGKTQVTYTATDSFGNTVTHAFTVTVYGPFGQFARNYRMAFRSFKNETYNDVTSSDVVTAWDNVTSVLPDINDEPETDLYNFVVIKWDADSDIDDSIPFDNFTHYVSIPNGALNATDSRKGKCLMVAAKELHDLANFGFEFPNGHYVLASSVISVTLFDEAENETKLEDIDDIFNLVQLNIQLKGSLDAASSPSYISHSPDVVVCAFWSSEGHWSDDGCRVVGVNVTYLTCECTHLTTFAALFRFSEKPSLQYSKAMEAMFKFLTVISIIALILGLMLLVSLWKKSGLNKDRSLININLMIAMMIVLVLLLVSDPAEANEITCLIVTILLHYALLAMFCWMSVEAIHLYRMIIVVFGAEKDLKLVYLAIGWGIPLLITAITAGIGRKDLNDVGEQGCWLAIKGGYVWAFTGPVILIILVNTIILVLVMFKTMKAASIEKDKMKLIKSGVKCLVLLLPLLGVIWIAGFVANQHIIIAYLFEILSALQGVYIVVVTCFVSSEVRDATKREFNKLSGRIGDDKNRTRMTAHSAATDTMTVAD